MMINARTFRPAHRVRAINVVKAVSGSHAVPPPPPPEEDSDSWPKVIDVDVDADADPDICEVLSKVFNKKKNKKKNADSRGFKRKAEKSPTFNQLIKKLQEEKDRVEPEHSKTMDLLREALSNTAQREAETLQGIVDRIRGSSDKNNDS